MSDRPKVVVTARCFPETYERLQAAFTVISNESAQPWRRDEILWACSASKALLAFVPDVVDEELIRRSPSLGIVACVMKGIDNIDVAACTKRGVWVSIVPDLLTEPTAELAVGLLISLARNVVEADRFVRAGRFSGWEPTFYGRGIAGSTVGILGGGAIGRAIATRLGAFGCRVLVHDSRPIGPLPANTHWCALEDLLPVVDSLILALPLLPATLRMVDQDLIMRLKRGCQIVNVARGSLVDEGAVVSSMNTGHLGGYAADVFEMEDLARPDRARRIHPGLLSRPDRTVLTPHLGSAVSTIRRRIELDAASNALEYLAGSRPHGTINEGRLRVPGAP